MVQIASDNSNQPSLLLLPALPQGLAPPWTLLPGTLTAACLLSLQGSLHLDHIQTYVHVYMSAVSSSGVGDWCVWGAAGLEASSCMHQPRKHAATAEDFSSTTGLSWTQNPSSQTAKAAAAAFDQLLAVAQLQEEVALTAPADDGLLKAIARQLLALGEHSLVTRPCTR